MGQDVEVPEPLSRVEELLIELKEAIEAGGGGGGDITQILARLSQCERDIDALELADTGLANAIQELVTAVNGKANLSDVYTKTEVDTFLNNKADKSTTYTKTEVDTALSGKQTALTTTQLAAVNSGIDSTKVTQIDTNTTNEATDRAALVELVDGGAKNHIDAPSGSGTRWTDITCNLPAGEWVLSFDELSTTWEAPTNNSIQIGFFTENYSSITSNYVYIDLDAKVLKVTTLDTAKIIRVYASPTNVPDKTITYRNAMICTEAAWNISQAYQPHRPSYDELIARIEALENA